MTNKDKFVKVFGFAPITTVCPTSRCAECPVSCETRRSIIKMKEWWDSEYKGASRRSMKKEESAK